LRDRCARSLPLRGFPAESVTLWWKFQPAYHPGSRRPGRRSRPARAGRAGGAGGGGDQVRRDGSAWRAWRNARSSDALADCWPPPARAVNRKRTNQCRRADTAPRRRSTACRPTACRLLCVTNLRIPLAKSGRRQSGSRYVRCGRVAWEHHTGFILFRVMRPSPIPRRDSCCCQATADFANNIPPFLIHAPAGPR
jgi:hypothetical protein